MDCRQTVLIVDECEETRDVLETVLTRCGVRAIGAKTAAVGRDLAQRHRPDVIVLDLETKGAAHCGDLGDQFSPGNSYVPDSSPRLILLGKMRRHTSVPPEGEVLAKPYHYAPLVRKIEGLLSASRADGKR